ncbi:DUF4352 domain-containing protein [Streptomyces sp. NBC_00322]|uniref:DUF4190 domain-containing protein n=1 Tax=Streptomyces sp. NBC_00322 TaxID=2975712 RepID=UPI002E2871D0|nr:DUF4352 domain-containing protein [Streptomyces sp. NBC_00322]
MSQYTQAPQPGPQQPYGGPGQYATGNPARNGLGTAALVLGIIGTITGFIPFLFWLGCILGLLALILGLLGRGRAKRNEATNRGSATAGAVLGLVAMIVGVGVGVVTVKAVDDAVDEINKVTENTAPKDASPGNKGGAGDKGAGDATAKKGESLAAGDTSIYDDDVKVTVSAAKSFSPGEFAIGHTAGNKAYRVTIVIENGGKKKFDANLVGADARAGKDGVTAEQIFDDKVGSGFSGTILPGRKATVQYAFDAPADAKSLTVEVTPGISYNPSHWELTL